MKVLKVIFRQTALDDLEEIWSYTCQNWSVEQADRYHGQIYKEIEFLATKPKSGRDISYVREGYMLSKVKSHLIFYKFSSMEIEIIRVLHEGIDIPNRLDE